MLDMPAPLGLAERRAPGLDGLPTWTQARLEQAVREIAACVIRHMDALTVAARALEACVEDGFTDETWPALALRLRACADAAGDVADRLTDRVLDARRRQAQEGEDMRLVEEMFGDMDTEDILRMDLEVWDLDLTRDRGPAVDGTSGAWDLEQEPDVPF